MWLGPRISVQRIRYVQGREHADQIYPSSDAFRSKSGEHSNVVESTTRACLALIHSDNSVITLASVLWSESLQITGTIDTEHRHIYYDALHLEQRVLLHLKNKHALRTLG